MIYVKCNGGLGNQFFQYAFGRALSLVRNEPLTLILDFDKHTVKRTYSLDAYPINAKIQNNIPNCSQYIEKEFNFNQEPIFFEQGKDVLYNGYWNTERYFKKYGEQIRKELSLNISKLFASPSFLNNFAHVYELSKNVPVVAVMVRRTDYVNSDFYITLGMDYYEKAKEYIENQLCVKPKYVFFSDDIDWCKKNFSWGDYFVANGKDYEDLALASLCGNHIIYNGTFGWWSAWLDENPTKVVVAPKQWFGSKGWKDWKDIYCDGWKII